MNVIDDNFVFLRASAELARGANADQFKLAWRTRNVQIADNVSVYSSGFARFRIDAPDVMQPQIWLQIEDFPIEVGSEVAIFGDSVNVQAAVKFNF